MWTKMAEFTAEIEARTEARKAEASRIKEAEKNKTVKTVSRFSEACEAVDEIIAVLKSQSTPSYMPAPGTCERFADWRLKHPHGTYTEFHASQ